jgi:predicted metal-binding protein
MSLPHAQIVACNTCGGARKEADGRSRGEHLIEHLERELARRGAEGASGGGHDVGLSSVRCLWACKRSCAVMLRSSGRVGYVLVELEPTEESARALLDYASLYLQTTDGAVPFKTWPNALRGHFHCRIPALDSDGPPLALDAPALEQRALEESAPEAPALHELACQDQLP